MTTKSITKTRVPRPKKIANQDGAVKENRPSFESPATNSTQKLDRLPEAPTPSRADGSKEPRRGSESTDLGGLLEGMEENYGDLGGNESKEPSERETKVLDRLTAPEASPPETVSKESSPGSENSTLGGLRNGKESGGVLKTSGVKESPEKFSIANLLKDIKLGKLKPEEIQKGLVTLEQVAKKLGLLSDTKKKPGQDKADTQGAEQNGQTAGAETAARAEHGPAAGTPPTGEPGAAGPTAGTHAPSGGAPMAGGAHAPKGPTTGLEGVPAGFLWKPVSEGNGNLVILTPAGMGAQSITVNGVAGTRQTNNGKNGGRDHFRFSQPGAAFGQSASVTITTANGSTQTVTIPNPAQRNEGRGQ